MSASYDAPAARPLLSRLLCCRPRRSPQRRDMGAALSHNHDGNSLGGCGGPNQAPATMAEVVRERKKKCSAYGGGGSGAALGTLRRRLAAAARARARACARAAGAAASGGAGGRRGGSSGAASRSQRPSADHARALRTAVAPWHPAEAAALLHEYEALAALRDVCTQAELARPPAGSLGSDLTQLYDDSICPDAELVLKGSFFPVHRAVLSARCAYFRDLLSGYPSIGARVSLENCGPWNLSACALDACLRSLYSGDINSSIIVSPDKHSSQRCQYSCDSYSASQDCCSSCPCGATQDLDIISAEGDTGAGTSSRRRGTSNCPRVVPCCTPVHPVVEPSLVRRLAEEFGFRPDALYHDMRYLLDSGDYADASLVFTSEPQVASASETSSGVPPGPPGTPPLPTHSRMGMGGSAGSEYGFRPKFELPCHRAVLCARSPFFRNIIVRRSRRQRESAGGAGGSGGWCPPSTVRIALDESVVPRRFARALLHAAYTDQVDLSLIGRVQGHSLPIPTVPSSRSNAAIVAQQNAQTILEDAMELYEIGRFVEMDIVAQGCEDAIVEALTPATLPRVLKWSSLPHGSKWVYRQAMRYLREEFGSVCTWGSSGGGGHWECSAGGGGDDEWWGGGALARLERVHLAAALRSPFLQASEAQALRAIIRWGEATLAKRMEDREPNVVMGTAHSVARRGIRRRDLSDSELRDVIAPLVRLLRLSHILPNDPVAPDILNQVMRRGLLSTPPSQLVGSGVSSGGNAGPALPALGSPAAWLGHGPYARPRLFMPYYEEVKALLEDQLIQESEILRVRRARYGSDIPDTLYMVDSRPRGASADGLGDAGVYGNANNGSSVPGNDAHDRDDRDEDNDNDAVESDVAESGDKGANGASNGSWGADEPVVPPSLAMLAMQARESELLGAPNIVRALALPLADQHEIRKQIRLRVVREHNYPDAVAEVLACVGLPDNQLEPPSDTLPMSAQQHDSPNSEKPSIPTDGSFKRYQDHHGSGVDLCLDAASLSRSHRSGVRLPAVVTEGNIYAGRCDVQPSCSMSRGAASTSSVAGLSEAMPDVAMATAGAQQRHHQQASSTTSRRNHNARGFAISGGNTGEPSCQPACAPQPSAPQSLPRPLYLNGNQHLLQDAGLRTINYPTGSGAPRRAYWHTQDWSSSSGGLQLDLGDGTPHTTNASTSGIGPASNSTESVVSRLCTSHPGPSAASLEPGAASGSSCEGPTSLERHRRRPTSQPHDHLNSLQRGDRSSYHVQRPNSSTCVLYSPVEYTRYLVTNANAPPSYSTLQHRQVSSYRSHVQPCSIDDETVGGLLSTPGLNYATLAAPPPFSHRSASPSTLHPLNYASHPAPIPVPAPSQSGHSFRRTDSCSLSTLSLTSNNAHSYYGRSYGDDKVYARDALVNEISSYTRVDSPFVSIQHGESSRGTSPAAPSRGGSPYAFREDWPQRKLTNSPGFSRPSSRGQPSESRGSFRDRNASYGQPGTASLPRNDSGMAAYAGSRPSDEASCSGTPRFM